jgi:hypothetical protein
MRPVTAPAGAAAPGFPRGKVGTGAPSESPERVAWLALDDVAPSPEAPDVD